MGWITHWISMKFVSFWFFFPCCYPFCFDSCLLYSGLLWDNQFWIRCLKDFLINWKKAFPSVWNTSISIKLINLNEMTKILVLRLVSVNTSRNLCVVEFHFCSFRGCLVGQSYRPILCSFQFTAVSILTTKSFRLRNVRLFFFYVCSLAITWCWQLIKEWKIPRVHC